MRLSFVLLLAFGLGLGAGCRDRTGEAPPAKRTVVTVAAPEPLLRWHFVGAAHLAGNALHAEPMPEPITFDTIIDPTTDNIVVRTNDAG